MMKSLTLAITMSAVGLAAEAAAQKPKAVEVSLSSASDMVIAADKVELILQVTINEDTSIAAALLSGHDLKCKIDGKPGPHIKSSGSGKVKLAGGTIIRRTIGVPVAQILPGKVPLKDMVRVTFEWSKMVGVGTTLTLMPDLSKVKVDDLDLSKTKVLLVTNFGNMTVKFRPDKAPNTVKNFIKLAKNGFYNGTRFHRVYPNFMIQGGCPNTKKGATGQPGTGDPGYKLKAEFNDFRHVRGVLSMARSNDPDSAGSQFFIMHKENRGLDGKYTAFGELDSGFETLDKICEVELGIQPGGREQSRPLKPVKLKLAIVEPVFKKKGAKR